MTETAVAANWPSDASVTTAAASFIKPFEGFCPSAYRCPAGVWTIGYGTTRYPASNTVCEGDGPITEKTATEYLEYDVSGFWMRMKPFLSLVPHLNQATAMVSLAYNIGLENFRKSSVRRDFNQGDFGHAAADFLKWDKITLRGRRKVCPGLLKRREAEQKRFQLS